MRSASKGGELSWLERSPTATGDWFESRCARMIAWHVYVLRSLRNGRLYTGSTNDLDRRLREHAAGHSPYTRHSGPFELVYTEPQDSELAARRRERFLKTGRGRAELA